MPHELELSKHLDDVANKTPQRYTTHQVLRTSASGILQSLPLCTDFIVQGLIATYRF